MNRLLSATVTVSIEASFTAVSIGYGLLPRQRRIFFGPSQVEDFAGPPPAGGPGTLPPVAFTPTPVVPSSMTTKSQEILQTYRNFLADRSTPKTDFLEGATPDDLRRFLKEAPPILRRELVPPMPPRQLQLGDVFSSLSRALGEGEFALRGQLGPKAAQALANGIRLNPALAPAIFLSDGRDPLEPDWLGKLFETTEPPPERVQFLYALRDEGTGREFQSDFLLNTSGLGSSGGERPFRYFAVPITFSPRTTVRLNIIPKTEFKGELYVVLHGYKMLGGEGTPTGRRLRPPRRVGRFRTR
ncbi:MAG: hypothetical protein LAN84_08470 [Acidobacteriia bacterium]|nr:hypothetical protein [Terriglobia bacterium]